MMGSFEVEQINKDNKAQTRNKTNHLHKYNTEDSVNQSYWFSLSFVSTLPLDFLHPSQT